MDRLAGCGIATEAALDSPAREKNELMGDVWGARGELSPRVLWDPLTIDRRGRALARAAAALALAMDQMARVRGGEGNWWRGR